MTSSLYIFCALAIWSTVVSSDQVVSERSFVIDYENNQYLKDGEHFRFISGSIHYFRVPRIYWQDRLEKMAAAGLNAVQTYIEWSQHEPYPGTYNFQDNLDVVGFIELAQKLGLLVILRGGPFICAEREFGGFPFWLLQKKPDIYMRSSDPTYIKYVDLWYAKLLPMLTPLLYNNGGPVISVQVENEFGGYRSCDFTYTAHLRDLFQSYFKHRVILHTTDGDRDAYHECGTIDEVYTTVDFPPGTNVTQVFRVQRNHQARGPLVNSEYYPGWMDNWGSPHHTTPTEDVLATLKEILSVNASVNMYMFHGGTNFGFTNGANIGMQTTTSYDYDAPLSEAGDPTPKYFAIRKLIANFTKAPLPPVPKPVPKFAYGKIKMLQIGSLFDLKNLLQSHKPIYSKYPVTFESLGQAYGFVLYETSLKNKTMDPAILNGTGVRDRAIIFVDEIPVGILSRADNIFNIPLTTSIGQKLSILVENMGRINVGDHFELEVKGLVSNVTLDGKILSDWTITPIPLNNSKEIDLYVKKLYFDGFNVGHNLRLLPNKRYYVPAVFAGSFVVPNNASFPMDTFFNPTGWNKGVVFVNGFNLGRYWPVVGPQITLYLPKSCLKPYPTPNTIMMFELENAPCGPSDGDRCTIDLVDTPILDGDTP